MDEIERVAGAGVVDAMARIVGHQAVVARIVEAAERQRRAHLAALGGVVVDDVEDDLEAGGVQAAHGDAHLVDGVVGKVARLGREEADGIVAPVVAQALLQQAAVLHEGVDRQELDRGHAEPPHVIDEVRVAQGGEGAALVRPEVHAQHAEAAHMDFIDDGVGPRHGGRAIVGPVEAVVADHRLQHARRTVAPVEGKVGARRVHAIAVQRIGRAQLAGEAPRIGIEQKLVMVEAMAVLRLVRAIGAITVDQPGARIGQIAVPDLVGAFRHLEALDLAPSRRIEQAELEPGGVGGKDGEIGAEPVPGGAQRIGRPGQQPIRQAHHVQPSARSITVESGGKVSSDGMRLAMRGLLERMDRAIVAEVAAAVEARIGVGDLAPAAGARHADAIAVARHGGHVADDQDRRAVLLAAAQEGEDGVGAIVADQPAEARGQGVALMRATARRRRAG